MPLPHNIDWAALKSEYENTPLLTYNQLSAKYKIPRNTIASRSSNECWRKQGDVRIRVTRAAQRINHAADQAIVETCNQVAAQVKADTARTLKDLAPWIEKMRAEHIKHVVGLSRKALGRVNEIFDSQAPKAPKDESFAAQAIDKHDNIIRRNLGMGDQNSTSSLNVNVLVAGGRSVHDAPQTKEAEAKEV